MGCQKILSLTIAAPIAVHGSVCEAACGPYSSMRTIQRYAACAAACSASSSGLCAVHTALCGVYSTVQSLGQDRARPAVQSLRGDVYSAYRAHTRTVSATRWCSELSLQRCRGFLHLLRDFSRVPPGPTETPLESLGHGVTSFSLSVCSPHLSFPPQPREG